MTVRYSRYKNFSSLVHIKLHQRNQSHLLLQKNKLAWCWWQTVGTFCHKHDCVRNLELLTDTKLRVQQHLHDIFSQAIRLLGLTSTVTFSLWSLNSRRTLYCTSVRPNWKNTWKSLHRNSGKLEGIQRQFVSLCQHRFLNHLD